jgi:hypothetical protein
MLVHSDLCCGCVSRPDVLSQNVCCSKTGFAFAPCCPPPLPRAERSGFWVCIEICSIGCEVPETTRDGVLPKPFVSGRGVQTARRQTHCIDSGWGSHGMLMQSCNLPRPILLQQSLIHDGERYADSPHGLSPRSLNAGQKHGALGFALLPDVVHCNFPPVLCYLSLSLEVVA